MIIEKCMDAIQSVFEYYDELKPHMIDDGNHYYIPNRKIYYYLLNTEDYNALFSLSWSKTIKSLTLANDDGHNITPLSWDSNVNITFSDHLRLSRLQEEIKLSCGTTDTTKFSADMQNYIIQQYSPFYRIDACWLSGSISLKDTRHEYGGFLLKSHAEIVGNGQIKKSHSFLFEQYAATYLVNFLPVYSEAYVNTKEIEDYALVLPIFLLSLSQFPSKLLPEILGSNLLMALMNEPILLPINSNYPSIFHQQKRISSELLLNNAIKAIEAYLSMQPEDEKILIATRINRGFLTSFSLIKNFHLQLLQAINDTRRFTIEEKMLSIIEKLGTKAFGYHKKGEIGNKPIDEWFDPKNFNSKQVLNALASSRYIKAGNPEKSIFLTYVTKPNGPMFRVFSDDDITVISNWILQLDKENILMDSETKARAISEISYAPTSAVIFNQTAINKYSKQKYNKCTLSEYYYYLLNIDQYPDIYPTAKQIAQQWLSRHRVKLFSGDCALPFKEYQHHKLDDWLNKKHEEQVSSYKPLITAPEEKISDVIYDATQLAPLTYIDGAWVRKMVLPGIVTSNVGSILYHIYVDELGNGENALHHGNIYRNLIKNMAIDLPEFDSYEFAKSTCFTDDALQVPVYWLAISLFPRTFMPEILGLNLAMELSGIGGEYRRSGDILKYYGFSAQFTALHNTIDNIVSGHTAWAIDAIKIHLDQIFQIGGRDGVQENWQRIWTGYRSLTPPPKGIYVSGITILSRLFSNQKSNTMRQYL